ncbi:hypothetical protein, partial [Klebsiella quasipneumoniae]|uniref:hypothetical protein n=1 Tax=Klebsiella quasipneumoniae TaxID=1463165 RepID=UPI001CFDF0D2
QLYRFVVYVIIRLTNAVPTLSHRTILEKQHSYQVTPRTPRLVAGVVARFFSAGGGQNRAAGVKR